MPLASYTALTLAVHLRGAKGRIAEDRQQAAAAGFDAHLTKPARIDDVLEQVRQASAAN